MACLNFASSVAFFTLRENAKLWWQSSVVGSSGLSQHVLVIENKDPVG